LLADGDIVVCECRGEVEIIRQSDGRIPWARGLDNDEPGIDVMTREQLTSVYLIRESDNSERMLRRQWDWMFEEKLFSWCRDSTLWPRKRTYKVFREWFDVRLVDLVFDLADAPIVLEDLG
jgi:hypothetical protein